MPANNTVSSLVESSDLSLSPQFDHLTTVRDPKNNIDWQVMNADPRPCFTPELLTGLLTHQEWIMRQSEAKSPDDMSFVVLSSSIPGVFNLGGDLDKFRKMIIDRDYEGLLHYGRICTRLISNNFFHLKRNTISISLIQGDALGGGFESAISASTIIAERGTKMGMPEALFNLFPGMGAFSFLSRRMPMYQAKKIIIEGALLSAEQWHDLGVVDILAEPGEGVDAVHRYIKDVKRNPNTHLCLQDMLCNDVRSPTDEEFEVIVERWAKAALSLRDKDLRMMDRLVKRQTKLIKDAA